MLKTKPLHRKCQKKMPPCLVEFYHETCMCMFKWSSTNKYATCFDPIGTSTSNIDGCFYNVREMHNSRGHKCLLSKPVRCNTTSILFFL